MDLYKKGWIYRGEFIINWDPAARTALSDIEVIHKDVEGAFYHMNYMLEDGSRPLKLQQLVLKLCLGILLLRSIQMRPTLQRLDWSKRYPANLEQTNPNRWRRTRRP